MQQITQNLQARALDIIENHMLVGKLGIWGTYSSSLAILIKTRLV